MGAPYHFVFIFSVQSGANVFMNEIHEIYDYAAAAAPVFQSVSQSADSLTCGLVLVPVVSR